MGLIYWWARIASIFPGIVNSLMNAKGIGRIIKMLGGISLERQMPEFAKTTFKTWFDYNPPKTKGNKKIILWPDTFNNYFLPETLVSAAEFLSGIGYEVIIPQKTLCCGRPLYDFGMLRTAKKLLKEILSTLREEIREGIPVVGLEPSCVATFRDELKNLFPFDENAKRLSKQTYLLSEFLVKEGYKPPKLKRKAVVHGHCHHKSILKYDDEKEIINDMGIDADFLDSGCCGMAGSFGFEKEKYDLSVKCGERVLLPAVRNTGKDTLIIANGFSCREQIEQLTNRKALHLAEVLYMAQKNKSDETNKEVLEDTHDLIYETESK